MPYGTDSQLDASQAINCLATFISPFGTTNGLDIWPQNGRKPKPTARALSRTTTRTIDAELQPRTVSISPNTVLIELSVQR